MKAAYLALLRGVNVGGKNIIKMADLAECLRAAGFEDVKTYIQSGNVIFTSAERDTAKLARAVEAAIEGTFQVHVSVGVFSVVEWREVVRGAPKWWSAGNTEWKHDLLVMLEPGGVQRMEEVIKAFKAKPEVEQWHSGARVVYLSIAHVGYSRSNVSKLVGTPVYKELSIRNLNTTHKLLEVLEAAQAAA